MQNDLGDAKKSFIFKAHNLFGRLTCIFGLLHGRVWQISCPFRYLRGEWRLIGELGTKRSGAGILGLKSRKTEYMCVYFKGNWFHMLLHTYMFQIGPGPSGAPVKVFQVPGREERSATVLLNAGKSSLRIFENLCQWTKIIFSEFYPIKSVPEILQLKQKQ